MDDQNTYYMDYLKDSRTFPRSIYNAAKHRIVSDFIRSFPSGSAILDAGCGCGVVTCDFSSDYRIYGVDNEPEAIRFCQQHFNGTYSVDNVYALSFGEAVFDGVVMNNAIEHLHNPRTALRELRRVLRPGGKIEVCTENYDSYLWLLVENTWYRLFGGNCRPFDPAVHPSRFTPKLLKESMGEFFEIESFVLRNFGMMMFGIGRKPG